MEEEVKFNHFMPAQIRFSDVDQFGHVNNSVYFSLYDLAKTTYFKDVLGMSDWGEWEITSFRSLLLRFAIWCSDVQKKQIVMLWC